MVGQILNAALLCATFTLSGLPNTLAAPLPGMDRQIVQAEYDFIIAGGGTAGLVLANRLSESGDQRVLVLESGPPPDVVAAYSPAGGNQFLGGTAIDWNFLTAEQSFINDRIFTYRRGRALGGSSVTNGLFYGRGSAAVYDQWEALGNPGWTWEEVYPLFVRGTHFNPPNPDDGFDMTYKVWDPEAYSDGPLQIGFQGYVPPATVGFMTACEAAGVPVVDELNTGNNTGVKQGTGNLDSDYRRSSSYDSFYMQAKDRPNLDVLHSAPVQSLIFDEESTAEGNTPRVIGVNFRDEPSSLYFQIYAAKEVIVALGAFHTPQFLMVSGIGPEEELGRFGINPVVVNENVGQHLNDHNVFSIMALATEDAGSATTRDNNVTNLILAQQQYYSGNLGTYTAPSGITNGFQQLTNQTLIDIGASAVVDQGYVNRAHVEFLFENIFYPGGPTPFYIPSGDEHYISVTASSLVALSRGNITLRGGGMQDIPVINPNYYADPTDRAIAINSFRDLRRILAHPALAQYTVGPNNGEVSPGVENVSDDDDEAIWAYVQENTIPNWHASGTAQMLPREDGGVVDPRLRVYGVENLRVVDCSIIPVLPDVNIVGPVYMIAEKGSDLIREDWGF